MIPFTKQWFGVRGYIKYTSSSEERTSPRKPLRALLHLSVRHTTHNTHLEAAAAEGKGAAHERARLLQVHGHQLHRPDPPAVHRRQEILETARERAARGTPQSQPRHVAQVAGFRCPRGRAIYHPVSHRSRFHVNGEHAKRLMTPTIVTNQRKITQRGECQRQPHSITL